MKMKTILSMVTMALAVFAAPQAAVADEVASGDIMSVDLVEDFGGTIPTKDNPLMIGQAVTVRVRLLNRLDTAGDQRIPWRFTKYGAWTSDDDPESSYLGPQLGLKFGGQEVFADYIGLQERTIDDGENVFTDMYFQYFVCSGDLALPAVFMTKDGGRATEENTIDYALKNCNYYGHYWDITDNAGHTCNFHFCNDGTNNPDTNEKYGAPHRYISGLGLNLYVKTIDFDVNYAQEAETELETPIWRKIYCTLTSTTTTLPAIKVDGAAESATVMYVWVDDETIAAPLSTDNVETVTDTVNGATVTRRVLKVAVPKSTSALTFKLKGLKNGETTVKMSSTLHYTINKAGDLVEDWVSRKIMVVDPPAPFVQFELLDLAGDPLSGAVTAAADYQQPVAVLRATLSQMAEEDTIVTLNPTHTSDGDDWAAGDAWTTIFSEHLIGLSATTDGTPWTGDAQQVKFNAGESVKTLYVYALGSTTELGNYGVKFTPKTDAAQFAEDDQSHTCTLVVKDINPVLVSPATGDEITDAMAGEDYLFDINIQDCFKDLRETGWKVMVKSSALGDSKWHTYEDGLEFDGDTGDLVEPLAIRMNLEGTHTLEMYLKDPSGKSSNHAKITVTVAAPKKAWATLDRTGVSYGEGETAHVFFHISQPSETASSLYAFLKPLNDDAKDKATSTAFTDPATAMGGVYIAAGDTDSQDRYAEIQLTDGKASDQYEVVICTAATYAEAKEAAYQHGQCVINVTNIVPVIKKASMGGSDVKVSGGIMGKSVALNVTKKFQLTVDEPGQYDLEATGDDVFRTQWKFGGGDWEDMDGNPNLSTTFIEHTFTTPGAQTVLVRCQDKDMRTLGQWTEEFEFTVNVLEMPAVVITPRSGSTTYYEDETGANTSVFDVTLTAAPEFANATDRLTIELTVTALGDDTAYSADDCELSKYTIEYRSGDTEGQTFYLKTLDGTSESAANGFRITGTVTAESQALDTEGKEWTAGEVDISVLNRDPTILTPAERLDGEGQPIVTVAQINTEYSLAWTLKDVKPDRSGMTVTWETSEGQKTVYQQEDGVLDDVMSGTHTFSFTSSGEKSITISVQDKDGGFDSRTFYYSIEASKRVIVSAHGPAAQWASANNQSTRYNGAAGLGRGRVDAIGRDPSSVTDWTSTYVVSVNDTTLAVTGTGYTTDENGHINTAIDDSGDFPKVTGNDYDYLLQEGVGANGFDSFFYCWICNNTKGYLTEQDIIYSPGKTANFQIPLETPEDNKTAYDDQSWEALFSREQLASDNCGDINQDFIPDLVVMKYGFDIFDTQTLERNGDDLATDGSIRDYNEDEDYLPTTAMQNGLIPGLRDDWVQDANRFTAKLELRGYGNGLNNAPSMIGLDNLISPDQDYTDLEMQAWKSIGSPDGWSPERPTDPTTEDTDGDGLPDGYEYYFWYLAHVGWLDDDGVHHRLVGHRMNSEHWEGGDVAIDENGTSFQASFDLITWETIETIYDPRSDLGNNAIDWNTQDTDGDGIPDLTEFTIGTNPLEWDTDGDGMPDGWEIEFCVDDEENTICDPLLFQTDGLTNDNGALNPDGDYMASVIDGGVEGIQLRLIESVDEDGRSVFYGTRHGYNERTAEIDTTKLRMKVNIGTGHLITYGDNSYICTTELVEGTDYTQDGDKYYILRTLEPSELFAVINGADTRGGQNLMGWWRWRGTTFIRGAVVDGISAAADEEYYYYTLSDDLIMPGDETAGSCTWQSRPAHGYIIHARPAGSDPNTPWTRYIYTRFNFEARADISRYYETYWTKEIDDDGVFHYYLAQDFGREWNEDAPEDPDLEGGENLDEGFVYVLDKDKTGTGDEAVSYNMMHRCLVKGEALSDGDLNGIDDDDLRDFLRRAGTPTIIPEGYELRELPELFMWTVPMDSETENIGLGDATLTAWEDRTYSVRPYGKLNDTYVMGLETSIPKDAIVIEIPGMEDAEIAATHRVLCLHWMAYQYRTFTRDERSMGTGFCPTTAWYMNGQGQVGDRWNNIDAGAAIDTREFRIYDEFLIRDFIPVVGNRDPYTVEDGLPNVQNVNQCTDPLSPDSDEDGVPDGWEAYVMGGPAASPQNLYWHVFGRNENGEAMSPLSPQANDQATDVDVAIQYPQHPPHGFEDMENFIGPDDGFGVDGMNELAEYTGTDTLLAYPDNETMTADNMFNQQWLNKFWPTDPWSRDTDCDGLADNLGVGDDGHQTINSDPEDDGSVCIRGGGTNPCSWDTDMDGLPDLWEYQYIGTVGQIGEAEEVAEGEEAADPEQGLINGMDPTYPDAQTVSKDGETAATCQNLDWDFDGLENWQEYMAGAIRAFRYDDTLSPWNYMDEAVENDDGESEYYPTWLDEGEMWIAYQCLEEHVDYATPSIRWRKFSPLDEIRGPNPGMIFTGSHDYFNAYFSCCQNDWDQACDSWYMFPDGPNHCLSMQYYGDSEVDEWRNCNAYVFRAKCDLVEGDPDWEQFEDMELDADVQYATCDPRNADTDGDSMDDYWELFHGLNPLLGDQDLVGNNLGGGAFTSTLNYWTVFAAGEDDARTYPECPIRASWVREVIPAEEEEDAPNADPGEGVDGAYDFRVFPWMAGLPSADPDGDGIINRDEYIQPNAESYQTWLHTDPSGLWMTLSEDPASITMRFYRNLSGEDQQLPNEGDDGWIVDAELDGDPATYGNDSGDEGGSFMARHRMPFSFPGASPWHLESDNMFAYEMNEGFDTDSDGVSDYNEVNCSIGSASDPLDADDNRHRQALYFQGEDNPSAAAMLQLNDPQLGYQDNDIEGFFLQFTVELWARPDDVTKDQMLAERSVVCENSAVDDGRYIRNNFALSIENGYWTASFDNDGTVKATTVKAIAKVPAVAGKWTHVAATFDGEKLSIYVNGRISNYTMTSLRPALGITSVSTDIGDQNDLTHESDMDTHFATTDTHMFLLGAHAKGVYDTEEDGWYYADTFENVQVETTQHWFEPYNQFYKGWIDEVRVWDGARSAEEIAANYTKRFTAEDAIANQKEIYDALKAFGKRDVTRTTAAKLPAELAYHYTFDNMFAAVSEEEIAKEPSGFGSSLDPEENEELLEDYNANYTTFRELERAMTLRAQHSRPLGWVVQEWYDLEFHSKVYSNYAYMPWLVNTMAHLPAFDGSTVDSVMWTRDFYGLTYCEEVPRSSFAFPRSREPYVRTVMVDYEDNWTLYNTQVTPQSLRDIQFARSDANNGTEFADLQMFAEREQAFWSTDLLPLGGAYVRVCDELWDGQGASSLWETTGTDENGNGFPDWWDEYAASTYTMKDGSAIDPSELQWSDIIIRDGTEMTASEAYQRDLANGMHEGDTSGTKNEYAQTSDTDFDGLPDWWQRLYSLPESSGKDDTDADGLSNYVEYMLSEVFDLGVAFDPRLAYSVNPNNLDYFYKIGQMYTGYIFTDHDMIEDAWEDQFASTYASRFAWNGGFLRQYAYPTLDDYDEDGWSVRSEYMYDRMCRSIAADKVNHYDTTGELQVDYPVPTLRFTVRYNGKNQSGFSSANVYIWATTDSTLQTTPDAVYTIAGAAEADDGNDGEAEERTLSLGRWSDRRIVGTLAPGNIVASSIKLETAYSPDSTVYRWQTQFGLIVSGTYEDYKDALRKSPDGITLLTTDNRDYEEFEGLSLREDPVSLVTTLVINDGEAIIGTINLKTGAYDIDLGALKDWQDKDDEDDEADADADADADEDDVDIPIEDRSFRLVYTSNTNVGSPRVAYLGTADTGHIREGVNYFIVWADTINANGEYDIGEPLGFVNGADISWFGRDIDVELTETNPIFARVDLSSDAATNDRDYWYGTESGNTRNSAVDAEDLRSGGQLERVRVVRTAVNGISTNPEDLNIYNRVVFDKWIDSSIRPWIFEGDFITDGEYDLDWSYFQSEIMNNSNIKLYNIDPTNVRYRVVFGQGDVEPQTTNNVFYVNFDRTFDLTANRRLPVPADMGVVTEAMPTFKWTMNGYNSYTAFKIVVSDSSGTTVYNSGVLPAPVGVKDPEDEAVRYEWQSPLCAGDAAPGTGVVFENGALYNWRVYMYNAKFRTDGSVAKTGQFYMNAPTERVGYGKANFVIRYAGRTYSFAKGVTRVQAFTSPDFSGTPVASGYVSNLSLMSNANNADEANAVVSGIPAGTVYFKAFIDGNNNGVCDDWESQGWYCGRGIKSEDMFNPTAVTFSSDKLGWSAPLTIWIEDMDTDRDYLPDSWEYATYGNLTSKGVNTVDTQLTGNVAVSKSMESTLAKLQTGTAQESSMAAMLTSSLTSSPEFAALVAGVDPVLIAADGKVEPEIVEKSVAITAIDFDSATGEIKLSVTGDLEKVETDNRLVVFKVADTVTVNCIVYRKDSLEDTAWTEVARKEIVIGGDAAEVTTAVEGVEALKGGFYKVEIVK